MFRWLIDAGADVRHTAKSGHNILQLAKGCCSKELYRFVRSEYKRLTRHSTQTCAKELAASRQMARAG